MAVMLAQASLETSLTRLNDDGRTLLFTEARTANTVSDRPVTGGKVRLLPHLQPGNVGKATQAPVNAILAVDSAFHHQIPRLFPAPGCGTLSKQTQGRGTRSAPAAHGCLSARRADVGGFPRPGKPFTPGRPAPISAEAPRVVCTATMRAATASSKLR